MKNWNTISGIPRFFSLRSYPPHRITFLLMVIASLISISYAAIYKNLILKEILLEGGAIFIASFVIWALARELDPDRVFRSYLAQALLIPIWLFFGPLAILPSTITLVSSRYITRISGLRWTIWDRLILFIAALGFMIYFQNPGFGIFGSLVFGADACLGKKDPLNFAFSAISALLSLAYIFFFWTLLPEDLSRGSQLVLVAVAILLLCRILRLKTVKSLTDFNDLSVQPKRLRSAILLALLLSLISTVVFSGNIDQFALLILAFAVSAL